jgi:hypothetical protein
MSIGAACVEPNAPSLTSVVNSNSADLLAEVRQHLDQARVGFGRDDEQRFADDVVDPVVGGRRHRDPRARDVRLRQRALAVVGANVAVDVEEAHRIAEVADATLRESAAELGGTAEPGEPRQLAPQGLHLGRAIEPEQAAEVGRRVLLERLGALDP